MHVLEPAWEALRREFDAACNRAAQAARSQTTHQLNQILRRLRSYQNEEEWIIGLLDGISQVARHVGIFVLNQDRLVLRGQRNLDLPTGYSFSIAESGAFANAIDSKDPVIALRTASEVTAPLSSPQPDERAHLVPVLNENRVVAIIFAASPDYIDVNALELIAGMGSIVLERKANAGLHAQIASASVTAKGGTPAFPPESQGDFERPNISNDLRKERSEKRLPAWSDLSPEHRALHLQAQRFSRVKVAEIQLSRPEACRAGRERGNLYLLLKDEIDKAREVYRTQFMVIPSMVDYLHLELVRTAADGDESKLGVDYPGPLV
jgi:hypothetical protein